MGSGYAHSFLSLSQHSQYLGTFVNLKLMFLEINQFFMVGRNSRCVDHQRGFRMKKCFRDERHIFFIMDVCSLCNQFLCQLAWSAVITAYFFPF